MFANVLALPDRWLDRITMYRLVIYYLIFVLIVAMVMSMRGTLGYPPIDLIGTTAVAVAGCLAVNALFARTFAHR